MMLKFVFAVFVEKFAINIANYAKQSRIKSDGYSNYEILHSLFGIEKSLCFGFVNSDFAICLS